MPTLLAKASVGLSQGGFISRLMDNSKGHIRQARHETSGKDIMDIDRKGFIAWLKSQHEDIMDCERRALACLDNGDKPGYSRQMHEKAEKLRDLHKLAIGPLKTLPDAERADVEATISRFSSGGATALSLDSLFYMSALLYPDDHKPGEPDNLERLISRLEKQEGAAN